MIFSVLRGSLQGTRDGLGGGEETKVNIPSQLLFPSTQRWKSTHSARRRGPAFILRTTSFLFACLLLRRAAFLFSEVVGKLAAEMVWREAKARDARRRKDEDFIGSF